MKRVFTLSNAINAVLTAVVFYFVKALFYDDRDVWVAAFFGLCIFILNPLFQWFFISRKAKR